MTGRRSNGIARIEGITPGTYSATATAIDGTTLTNTIVINANATVSMAFDLSTPS
jgi:hypothetical protein